MQFEKKWEKITESENLNQLLKRILDLSQEVLQSEAATLFLVDHNTEELVFKIVNGPEAEKLQGKRIKIGEGIAGRTAREGKSFIVNKPKNDGYADKFDKQTGFNTESLLAAPLIIDGETIGVIEVINSRGGDYNERSKEIIEQLAAQVSSELKMTLLSERLSKSEEFLNSIINSLPGGIIILDEKGVIRKSNPTAEMIFHIKEVEGKNLKEVIPDTRILDNIESIKDRGSFEAIIRKNGKENHLIFELSKAKEISSSGIEKEHSIIQINNITERVELNRLKYFQEINANFTLGLSHRLRTPLTPILGLSSILKDQKDISENFKEMAKIIYDSSLEMKDMVEKLLDIAEIGTDKTIQTNEKIEFKSVLNEIIQDFGNITITSNIENDNLDIYGNRSWLVKSLRQLFTICVKKDSKSLKVELEENKEYLYLNFRNSKSLIDDFSALENAPILSFDNPLTGDSDIKYLDIPLIRLILNKHNVKITIKEDELLLSLRFKKVES